MNDKITDMSTISLISNLLTNLKNTDLDLAKLKFSLLLLNNLINK